MKKRNGIFWMLLFVAVLGLCMVIPKVQAAESITLLYDDRKELTSLVDTEGVVTISDEVVTSCKVGTTTLDDHVLVYQDGVLYAVGTGTATLTVGEKSYNVTVSPAPISLFMITGHSTGAGQEGNGSQSVVVEAGQAYSSYHQNSLDVTEIDGYGLGWGSENRVGGEEGLVRSGWDSYGHLDSFAPGMGGTTGIGSGFAYRWNQLTGEKVWVINIAIGGSCINEWMPGAQGHNTAYDLNYYDQTISKFTYAQTILKNEVSAGHYTLSKQGIVNFAGANFSWYNNWSNESLEQDYETLWNAYKQELFGIDIDGDGSPDGLDVMAFRPSWSGAAYSGDRPAALYMGSSAAFSQHVVISNIGEQWYSVQGIQNTFPAIDYTTQSVKVTVPVCVYHTDEGGTSENSLFDEDKTHYRQAGYNALGLDMGKELAKWFFTYNQAPTVESFALQNRTMKEIPDTVNITVGENFMMTPRVSPVTVSDLTYEVTGAAELTYPLVVKGTSVGTATLTVKQGDNVLKTVTFNVSEAHAHCECGEILTGAAAQNHICDETTTYEPLTKDSFTNWRYTNSSGNSTYVSTVLREGNYYLTGDYAHTGTIYVAPGATVKLCLNGYKLTTTSRSLSVNGELSICDCSDHGTGAVYSKSAGNAPTVYTTSGGVLSIYGGSYSAVASSTREFGGCLAVSHDLSLQNCDLDGDGTVDNTTKIPAVAKIYGGKFIGSDLNCADGSPTVSGIGACIYITSNNTLNIFGGEFVGARPVPVEDGGKGGGGIIGNNGICNIYGGTFRGSRCSMGGIWTSNSKLTISGSPVFEDNYNADIFLHYCDHFYVGEDGIDVEKPIRVAGSIDNWTKIHLTDDAQAACFVGAHGLTMTEPTDLIMKYTRDNTYCECGGTISDEVKTLSGHTCADATWLSLSQGNLTTCFTTTSTTEGQTSTARYYLKSKEVWLYLSGNVNLTNEIEISDGYTLHIDLNGYTITHSTGTASLFRVYGNLTICDSSPEQTGKAIGVRVGTTNAEASCVYALNYNSYGELLTTPGFNLYSGTLTGFNITSNTDRTRVVANQAGVVQIGNNSGNKDATFNMYGGTIKDGKAVNGGNVLIGHGKMNMYDGLITGGTATESNGGNIRVSSNNTLHIYGGTISHGLAATTGGNLYFGSGTLEIRDAALIGGGATNGGNVYVYNGTANITDTVLKDGKAGYTFTRNADGTLSHSTTGAPSGSAGNLFINDAIGNLVGCTLENGISYGKNGSNGFGGNIYNKYTLTMDNCTVSGGEGFRGGVVGIRDNSSLGASYTELKNCTFFNNSASVAGSSVGLWANTNGATILIENCTFDDSMNDTHRGVISLTHANCTAQVSLTVKDCTVKCDDPNDIDGYAIYANYGTVTLEGTADFAATAADLYLTESGALIADNFAPEAPITVEASFGGKIGTSVTDKSGCFENPVKGISWVDGELFLNGLLQASDGSTYKSFVEALSTNVSALTLLSDYDGGFELTDELYLDLNGNVLTGDITGTGTLYGMDSATDGYTTENMGRITGTVSCNVAGSFKTDVTGSIRRYLAIQDDIGYTFHRIYLGITHMSLKPADTGVGYKAVFCGDEMVQELVSGYGYTLWVGEDGKPVTAGREGSFTSGKAVTLRLKNFDVAGYGEVPVYGKVYITLTDGTTIQSADYDYTLRELVEAVAANVDTYSQTQLEALQDMLAKYAEATANWDIDSIRNYNP